jgi:flagellar protein FliS
MLSPYAQGATTYATVGLETAVDSASPHGLIVMLYDGAIQSIANARARMVAGDVGGKAKSIHKAVEIINKGLNASLDPVAGGEMAQNLKDLYDYMGQQLLLASLKNDTLILDHVRALLMQLRDAWKSIADRPAAKAVLGNATPARSFFV